MKIKLPKLLLLLLTFQGLSQIPTNGLVGAWTFNGNANDMSGNGNHGTVYGASLTTDRCGNPNAAYSFNGINNYIQTLFAGPTGTVSRSVSFWARTTATNLMTNFAYGNSSGGLAYAIQYNYSCPGVGIDVNNQALTRGNSCILNSGWHHIVAILNSSVSTQLGGVIFYVDGVLQPSVSCVISGSVQTINTGSIFPISFGRIHDASARYFNGDMDDFYLYNRVLSSTEVQQLFTACSPPIVGNTLVACSSTNIGTYSIAPLPGANSYSWTLPGGWSGTSTTNVIQVTGITSSGAIQVAANNSCGGLQLGSSLFVSIFTPSNSGISISASSNSVCAGSSATLFASGASNYTWLPSGQSGSSVVIMPSATTVFTINGMSGFCQLTQTTNVVVANGPSLTAGVLTNPVCSGNTVSLISSGASTYSWAPGAFVGAQVTVLASNNAVYTVTGTNQQGCTSAKTVTISALPNPTITVSTTGTVTCSGGYVQLTANGANNYTWVPGGGQSPTLAAYPLTTTNYTVYGDVNGCVSSNTTQIIVSNSIAPSLTITQSHTNVCSGSSATLLAYGASSYTWSPGNIISNQNIVSPLVSTIYTLSGINSVNNCMNSRTVSLVVAPLPSLSVTASSSIVCRGESSFLTASGASTYSWSPGNVNSPTNFVGPLLSNNVYTVSGSGSNGCSSSATIQVSISDCLSVWESNNDTAGNFFAPNPLFSGPANYFSTESGELTISNSIGEVLMRFSITRGLNPLGLSELAKGTYIVFFSPENKAAIKVSRLVRD